MPRRAVAEATEAAKDADPTRQRMKEEKPRLKSRRGLVQIRVSARSGATAVPVDYV
jgi:hypothetical protein